MSSLDHFCWITLFLLFLLFDSTLQATVTKHEMHRQKMAKILSANLNGNKNATNEDKLRTIIQATSETSDKKQDIRPFEWLYNHLHEYLNCVYDNRKDCAKDFALKIKLEEQRTQNSQQKNKTTQKKSDYKNWNPETDTSISIRDREIIATPSLPGSTEFGLLWHGQQPNYDTHWNPHDNYFHHDFPKFHDFGPHGQRGFHETPFTHFERNLDIPFNEHYRHHEPEGGDLFDSKGFPPYPHFHPYPHHFVENNRIPHFEGHEFLLKAKDEHRKNKEPHYNDYVYYGQRPQHPFHRHLMLPVKSWREIMRKGLNGRNLRVVEETYEKPSHPPMFF